MKSFFRRTAARIREFALRVRPPQCSCGFPAEFLVIEADGRKRWLCDIGFEEMIDTESGRRWWAKWPPRLS